MTKNEEKIKRIKRSGALITNFGNSPYSDLWYVDTKNKICITFTPRGGCSKSFQQYLDLLDSNLLKDGLDTNNFIHNYRVNIFDKNVSTVPIVNLIKNQYKFIKFIMNPYIRAVSIFRVNKSGNLSFRNFMKQMVFFTKRMFSSFNVSDKYHCHQQYIKGEENIITKYIRINEDEKYNIQLKNGENYELNLNKYTTTHEGKKTLNTEFCGDIPRCQVNQNLPLSYKYFYDEEIKNLVYFFYKDDFVKYNFNFDF